MRRNNHLPRYCKKCNRRFLPCSDHQTSCYEHTNSMLKKEMRIQMGMEENGILKIPSYLVKQLNSKEDKNK